ncbi:hypothetical protein BB559_004281 [Furculomyces boomerangus]|uniref:RRM domain-containing protein n=2 Tax=Harpellales TaxID=61421 RepID=A0A2T9Y2E9_9FUNG|nr:hypothetical protein BB559_006492 [Furculomyces boomerangus]PVU91136.1 hypothetical protein BB559_004281 [Furculomyces boomerangus]PWA01475.1 hypothetical protein BB558_002440 [Smittium angustum]
MFALRSRIAPFTSKFLTNSRQFCIKSVYVGNIPWATTEDDLRKIFGVYGKVDTIYIPRSEDGKIKGYGFIRYIFGERPESGEFNSTHFPTADEIDACTEIIKNVTEKMNGVDFMGRSLRVSYSQVGSGSEKFKNQRQEPRNDQKTQEPKSTEE